MFCLLQVVSLLSAAVDFILSFRILHIVIYLLYPFINMDWSGICGGS